MIYLPRVDPVPASQRAGSRQPPAWLMMDQRGRETVSQDALAAHRGFTIALLLVTGRRRPLADQFEDTVADGGHIPPRAGQRRGGHGAGGSPVG